MRLHPIAFVFIGALGALGTIAGCSHGELLPVGTSAPDRTLVDQTGAQRTLASFRGRPLVVYFYPRDATPGCTREACAFRDSWLRYEELGLQIVGVSTDSPESHAAFAREHDLPFPLLSDPNGALAEAFGVKTHFGMASRVSFVLDADGVVRAVFRNVDPGVHSNEVLAEATRLGLTAHPTTTSGATGEANPSAPSSPNAAEPGGNAPAPNAADPNANAPAPSPNAPASR